MTAAPEVAVTKKTSSLLGAGFHDTCAPKMTSAAGDWKASAARDVALKVLVAAPRTDVAKLAKPVKLAAPTDGGNVHFPTTSAEKVDVPTPCTRMGTLAFPLNVVLADGLRMKLPKPASAKALKFVLANGGTARQAPVASPDAVKVPAPRA